MENKKYLVKKVVYEEVVDEEKLKTLIDEYNVQIKPTEYAKRDGINMIAFQPRPSYWLDVQELCNEEYDYEDDDLQDYCDDEEYDRDC